MLRRRTVSQLMTAAALAPLTVHGQGTPPLTRIAFGSCADQAKPQPIWDAVLADRPDLFLFVGDNVYGDSPATPPILREAYAPARGIDRLRQAAPRPSRTSQRGTTTTTAATTPAPSSPFKGEAKARVPEVLRDGRADDPRRARDGIYDSPDHWTGRHARAGDPARHPLLPVAAETYRPARGARQGALPARPRSGQDHAGRDAVDLARRASCASRPRSASSCRRSRCWPKATAGSAGATSRASARSSSTLIRDARANGVIFLSGDRHIGALYRETPPGVYPLTEVTSSGLNQIYWAANEPGPNRLGPLYAAANFGVIEIDWWDRSIGVGLRDAGGTVRRSATITTAPAGTTGIAHRVGTEDLQCICNCITMDVELEFEGFQWTTAIGRNAAGTAIPLPRSRACSAVAPASTTLRTARSRSAASGPWADQCRPLHACGLHGPGTARHDPDPPDQRPLHAWQGDTTL